MLEGSLARDLPKPGMNATELTLVLSSSDGVTGRALVRRHDWRHVPGTHWQLDECPVFEAALEQLGKFLPKSRQVISIHCMIG